MQTRNRKPHDISRQCRSLGEIIRKPDRCLHEDPRKITDCGLFSFYLAAQCKQGQRVSLKASRRRSRCFFISRCRPGCLGWWGPCDTFRNIIRENSTIPRCTGGPRIRGSLWSDSFGHERWLVGRLDYRRSTVCSNLFKDTLPPARIHSQYTTTITRDCFILPTSDRYIIGL